MSGLSAIRNFRIWTVDSSLPENGAGGDAFEDLVGVKRRLGGCERVGGSGGRLAINEGQGIGSYTKPLEVRSGQLQVHFTAIAAYMVDLKNGLAAPHCYFIAYQWYWWLSGNSLGGRFLAGLSHDPASLAEYDGFHGS